MRSVITAELLLGEYFWNEICQSDQWDLKDAYFESKGDILWFVQQAKDILVKTYDNFHSLRKYGWSFFDGVWTRRSPDEPYYEGKDVPFWNWKQDGELLITKKGWLPAMNEFAKHGTFHVTCLHPAELPEVHDDQFRAVCQPYSEGFYEVAVLTASFTSDPLPCYALLWLPLRLRALTYAAKNKSSDSGADFYESLRILATSNDPKEEAMKKHAQKLLLELEKL